MKRNYSAAGGAREGGVGVAAAAVLQLCFAETNCNWQQLKEIKSSGTWSQALVGLLAGHIWHFCFSVFCSLDKVCTGDRN